MLLTTNIMHTAEYKLKIWLHYWSDSV